jgi:hypothetical protein
VWKLKLAPKVMLFANTAKLQSWGVYPMKISGHYRIYGDSGQLVCWKYKHTFEENNMNELTNIASIAGLFLLRIGVPLVLFALLGILIDRWQSKREEEIKQQYLTVVDLPKEEVDVKIEYPAEDEDHPKAA